MIATVLRGLISRRVLNGGALLLAVVAIAAGVLGPTYQRAATQSYLVVTLRSEPAPDTGILATWKPEPGDQVGETDARTDFEAVLPPQFTAPNAMLVADGGVSHALGVHPARPVFMAGADDPCGHVTLVAGHCPTAPGDIAVLQGDLGTLGVRLGERVRAFPGRPAYRVVGLYAADPAQSDWWFDPATLASVAYAPALPNGMLERPFQPAPFLTTPATVADLDWSVRLTSRLDVPADVSLAQVRAAADAAGRLQPTTRLQYDFRNDLPDLVTQIDQRQQQARSAVAPAMVALILVAAVLLLRLFAAAVELRRPELGLAALRGWTAGRMWAFGLAEPYAVLVAAVPLGAAAGFLATLAMARMWFEPGLPVTIPAGSAIAVAAVTVLLMLGTAWVLRRTLTETVADRLAPERRPAPLGRTALVGVLLLVAATLAVGATALLRPAGGSPDLIDLIVPILLAILGGLVAAALVRLAARAALGRTARSRRLAGFLAARTLARRSEAVLMVLPLAAAATIGVFAAGIETSAAHWRESAAATLVGADLDYETTLPLNEAMALTHRLDPDGRYLMAAATDPLLDGVVVDADRLDAVAAWPADWGMSAADAARASRRSGRVVLQGARIGATLESDASIPVGVIVTYLDDDEQIRTAFLGPYSDGTTTRTADLRGCARGCALGSMTFGGPNGQPAAVTGTATLQQLTVDGAPVDLGSGWHPTSAAIGVGDGFALTFDAPQPEQLVLDAPDLPAPLPVLTGRGVTGPPDDTNRFAVTRAGDPLESMPFRGPSGRLVDASTFLRVTLSSFRPESVHVLARADTPPAILHRLSSRGMTGPTRLSDVRRVLDHEAFALVLRLYLVVSAVVLVLAAGGLVATLLVQLPARRREAAALRVAGVRRRSIIGGVALELTASLLTATVVGAAVGWLAQWIVVRSVTLGYATDRLTPRSLPDFGWADAAVLVAPLALVLLALAVLTAAGIVRGARAATLRENAR